MCMVSHVIVDHSAASLNHIEDDCVTWHLVRQEVVFVSAGSKVEHSPDHVMWPAFSLENVRCSGISGVTSRTNVRVWRADHVLDWAKECRYKCTWVLSFGF